MVSLIHNLDDTKWVEVNSSDRGEGKTIQSRKNIIIDKVYIFIETHCFDWLWSAKSRFVSRYDGNDRLPLKRNVLQNRNEKLFNQKVKYLLGSLCHFNKVLWHLFEIAV